MRKFAIVLIVCLLVASAGCKAPATPAPTSAPGAPAGEVTTIKFWDYYGSATPFTPEMIAAFEAENPGLKVQYEALNWDTMFQKLSVALTTNTAPDVATVDMTWVPTWASLGGFTELDTISGGTLNGVPFGQAFTAGALEAMTYQGKVVTVLEDFDVYCLYYRVDLFEAKGLKAPTTWDELVEVGQKLAEDTNGDGTPDKYLYGYFPETFRWSQFLYENGGTLLNDDNTKAVLNSPEGLESLQFFTDMASKYKFALDLSGEEFIQLVKDGTVAMFSDGPYQMGTLKSGAPEMAKMWMVAPHPYKVNPGSYLGGTGLVIPVGAANKEAAWKFIQFATRLENAIGVYKNAGAAPGLKAALESPGVSVPDPYFRDQVTLPIFLKATETAHHFPYVRQWNEIAAAIDEAVAAAVLGEKTPQQALDDAATKVDALLQE